MRRGSRLCCIFYDQCGSCWASNSRKLCVYSYFRSKHSLILRNVRVDAVNSKHWTWIRIKFDKTGTKRRMFCRLIWGHRKKWFMSNSFAYIRFWKQTGVYSGDFIIIFLKTCCVVLLLYKHFPVKRLDACSRYNGVQRNSPVKGSKTPALTYTTAKRKRTKALVSLLTCCNFSLCSDLKLVQPSYFFFSFLSVFQLHKDTKMKH